MSRKILATGCALLVAALLISACSSPMSRQQEKIAVINWEQAVKAHPEQRKLEQGEKILKDLLEKRKEQETLSKAQLSSLSKLQQLKRLSKRGYLDAEFNTRMAEQQAREQSRLQAYVAKLEPEADGLIAERKKQVEDSYQLKLFNLRAVLESVKMRPAERAAVEEQLAQAKAEREIKLGALQDEKRAYMDSKLKPYMEQLHKRMAEQAAAYRQEAESKLAEADAKDTEMVSGAPQALDNILAIMDREIDKQQEKNKTLQENISKDISSIANKLAHERGYTIIFNQYKVNLKAEDITDDVIKGVKNTKNK